MWLFPLLPFNKVIQTEPIVTDRPDFTESSFVVPLHRVQIEAGFTRDDADGSKSLSGPEALVRYGVSPNWELRFGLPDYNDVRAAGSTTRGWGDLNLGAKYQIGQIGDGIHSAVIFGATFPTGHRAFRSETIDPEVKLCFSRDLSPKVGASAMIAAAWPTIDGRRQTALQTTLSFGFATTDRSGFFAEYAGNFFRGIDPEHIAHFGFTYQPNSDSQWDVHFGFTPVGREKRTFVGAGYSIRY